MSRRIAVIPAVLLLLALAAAPAHAARNAWRQVPTWNIAHQGGEDEFPSNTMYAFKRALKAGADMLELDVGVTSDDQVVVSVTGVERQLHGGRLGIELDPVAEGRAENLDALEIRIR